LPEFFSTHQTLLIWRVTVDLRVGHSIYEVTFHPRNARAALFAVSGGDALSNQLLCDQRPANTCLGTY
jgi:hypothetical protein